jgi:hypothetical protein
LQRVPMLLLNIAELQDQWKVSGKAGKVEDELWARFRAAGDAIFAAKKEQDAELREAQAENLKLKLEILEAGGGN